MKKATQVLAVAMALVLGGCTAGEPPQDLPEEAVGSQEQALTCSSASSDSCILTSYDGYAIFKDDCSDGNSFYSTDTTGDVCCTAGTSGCRYTGLRWQCVEWARRYMWKKWGPVWSGVTGAQDMCASRPTGTVLVNSPVPGDVVVYGAGACLKKDSAGNCTVRADTTYGHVGVVFDNPSSTKDGVKDQNGPQNSSNNYLKSAVKCYVHATANTRSCFPGDTQSGSCSSLYCAEEGQRIRTCVSPGTWGAWSKCVCPM